MTLQDTHSARTLGQTLGQSFGPMQGQIPSGAAVAEKSRGFVRRALIGGSVRDSRRLPRYIYMCALGLTCIWAPITGYLKTAAPVFASHMSLILPGSGSASSVNLAEIGQAALQPEGRRHVPAKSRSARPKSRAARHCPASILSAQAL